MFGPCLTRMSVVKDFIGAISLMMHMSIHDVVVITWRFMGLTSCSYPGVGLFLAGTCTDLHLPPPLNPSTSIVIAPGGSAYYIPRTFNFIAEKS